MLLMLGFGEAEELDSSRQKSSKGFKFDLIKFISRIKSIFQLLVTSSNSKFIKQYSIFLHSFIENNDQNTLLCQRGIFFLIRFNLLSDSSWWASLYFVTSTPAKELTNE